MHVHRLVVDVVLCTREMRQQKVSKSSNSRSCPFENTRAGLTKRLLARAEGGGDLLARAVVHGGGELGLQLGLHGPGSERFETTRSQSRASLDGLWTRMARTYRLPSRMSSERASPHEANSAGCRVTWAREKSRTGQARRDQCEKHGPSSNEVSRRRVGQLTLDLALNLRLDKREDIFVQARADFDQSLPANAQRTNMRF